MQIFRFFLGAIGLMLLASCGLQTAQDVLPDKPRGAYKKLVADEHYFFQRSYPDTVFPISAYHEALKIAHADFVLQKQLAHQRSGSPLVWEP